MTLTFTREDGRCIFRERCYFCGKLSKRYIELSDVSMLYNTTFIPGTPPDDEGWEIYEEKSVCKACSENKDVYPISCAMLYLHSGQVLKSKSGNIFRKNEEADYEYWDGSKWIRLSVPPGFYVGLRIDDSYRFARPEDMGKKGDKS